MLMTTKKYDDKTEKPLNAVIDLKVYEEFDRQRKLRSQVKKVATTAAIRLWIALPSEIQARLLDKSLSDDAFIEFLDHILDQRIMSGYDAGLKLIERQKRKLSPKG